ncbi:MAG: helix-turn-helix transcriptional regulator [Lentisphaeria bacterium]|nr:helix-turn-helix transcriptional regulator [Lentisphaeria bacterium]
MTDYFDGIRFVTFGNVPDNIGKTSKSFNGYYGIQYNNSGGFYLSIDRGEPVYFEGPHAFLTYPGPHFEYGSRKENETRHHIFCCFEGERVQDFIQRGLFVVDVAHPVIRITRPESFLATMRNLQSTLSHSFGEQPPARAVLLLEDLLLQLHEQPPLPDTELHLYHPLLALSEAIRKTPQADWDMEKEARKIGISVTYLRKLFAEYFTYPPHNYILECRLRFAEDQLLHRNIPISEVAENAGFRDPYYFSRLFKKRKGISPLRFRAAFAP